MKKRVLLVALLVVTMLTGCGEGGAPEPELSSEGVEEILVEEILVEEILVEEIQVQEIQIKGIME